MDENRGKYMRLVRSGCKKMEKKEEGRKHKVPMLVGKEGNFEKIWVPIKVINHHRIVELLDKSQDEFGYHQGLLRIYCDIASFKNMLRSITNN
ncbi:Small auxin-up RNA [Senna tora]|uniref:Small auxin-up RNA n=1 Tax=Senna tora TaxID=362788 RepID=A0A835C687_9FABA|nr:Small auxin-up RNA [Senna tora]